MKSERLRQFGWTESIKETCREQRGVTWLENLVQDIRFGARQLRKNPGFTAVAVLTLALGAERWNVIQLVLRQGMRLVGAGIGVGLLGTVAVSRVLKGMIYDLSPLDPIAVTGATLALLVAALLACWLPAHRAIRVEPIDRMTSGFGLASLGIEQTDSGNLSGVHKVPMNSHPNHKQLGSGFWWDGEVFGMSNRQCLPISEMQLESAKWGPISHFLEVRYFHMCGFILNGVSEIFN